MEEKKGEDVSRRSPLRSQTGGSRDVRHFQKPPSSEICACLEYLFEATPDCVWVKDSNGRYLYANSASAALLGTSPEAAIGKDDSAFFPAEEARVFIENDREVMQGGELVRFEESGSMGDEIHTFLSIKMPYRDEAGTVVGVAGICRDITDRKQLEDDLRGRGELLKELSALSAQSLALEDPKDFVVRIADAVDRHLGLDACFQLRNEEGAFRLEFSRGISGDASGALERVEWSDWTTLFVEGGTDAAGPAPSPEATDELGDLLARDGVRVYVIVPIRVDGNVKGALGFGSRRPTRLGAEVVTLLELVAVQVASVYDRVTLIRELRSRAVQLTEAGRRKDEFLAMLAHELRNPLGAIDLAVRLLDRPRPEEKLGWSREVIGGQVKHLSRLIDDLLDVSRITRGKIALKREPVDLCAVVAKTVELIGTTATDRGQRIDVDLPDVPLVVLGDPVRLRQIFENILTNASKYSGEGGRIEVLGRAEEGEAVLTVSDNGVGIPRHVLPYVFDLFAQADRTLDRAAGGLGIGLTLVKRLCELHGGSVTASSDGPSQGSRFEVRLPLALPKEAPGESRSSDRASAAGAVWLRDRILVVEDNSDLRVGLRELLSSVGYRVQTASSGREALQVAPDFLPSVVLLDIGLPEIDGYELARRLRRLDASRDALLVAVSGYAQEADVARSKEAGIDAHFAKPLDFDRLLDFLGKREDPGRAGPV